MTGPESVTIWTVLCSSNLQGFWKNRAINYAAAQLVDGGITNRLHEGFFMGFRNTTLFRGMLMQGYNR